MTPDGLTHVTGGGLGQWEQLGHGTPAVSQEARLLCMVLGIPNAARDSKPQ